MGLRAHDDPEVPGGRERPLCRVRHDLRRDAGPAGRDPGDDPGSEGRRARLILVVGGFDSSNTAHLVEIPHDAGKTVFHINEGDCIREDNSVKHRLLNGDVVIENDWLPADRPLKIGVTSGASTPDAYVQDALERLVLL